MKKYIFLAFALFGMLSIGSCNDDEPIVPPVSGRRNRNTRISNTGVGADVIL